MSCNRVDFLPDALHALKPNFGQEIENRRLELEVRAIARAL
jgi:hypothetical protein